jgi:hypothetical protein
VKWIKNLIKKTSSKKHQTNRNTGKSFDEMYQDFGAFQYDKEGFTLTYENFTQRINWDDITQLNVYKTDLLTTDRVDMEIVYGEKYITINEELPGWYQFILKTKETFASIPKDWDITIIQPPFETNYRTIYEKVSTV